MAKVDVPAAGKYEAWKEPLVKELRRVTFDYFPERIPRGVVKVMGTEMRSLTRYPIVEGESSARSMSAKVMPMETEPGIRRAIAAGEPSSSPSKPERIVLVVRGPNAKEPYTPFVHQTHKATDAGYLLSPRGVDQARWTTKNPPNFVERSFALIGRTADTCRVWDIIAAARYLHAAYDGKVPVYVLGEERGRRAGGLRGCAGAGHRRRDRPTPPLSHMDNGRPCPA